MTKHNYQIEAFGRTFTSRKMGVNLGGHTPKVVVAKIGEEQFEVKFTNNAAVFFETKAKYTRMVGVENVVTAFKVEAV